MLTPSFWATSRALTNCLMGCTSATAPTAATWRSTPLTREIRRSFEPAVVMFLIYGTRAAGVKSQTVEVKTGLEITEPGCGETAGCSVNRDHQCLLGFVLGGILPARDLCVERIHSDTEALGDCLRIVPQGCFRIGMTEVTLHILDRPMLLDMR